MDKSFDGLLVSVILHGLLLWALLFLHLSPPLMSQDRTEITLIEKPSKKEKMREFVTETEKKPIEETAKEDADFLSMFTKRVKKQLRAPNIGPTVNLQPQLHRPNEETQTKRAAGMDKQVPKEPGVGSPGGEVNTPMKTVAIGASSLSEYIPGVEEGAFTALNTNQFTYYAFFARMHEQVRNRWVRLIRTYMSQLTQKDLETLAKRDRQTDVEITLGPGGQFVKATLYSSCGEKILDGIPGQAFAAAAPFPNPPQGMFEADGLIHLRYSFYLQFRPPGFGQVQ